MTEEHDGTDRGRLSEDYRESRRAVDDPSREGLDRAVERLAEHFRAKPDAAHVARALTLMTLGIY